MSFDEGVISSLESYVYLYSDPRSGLPFYIGKGLGIGSLRTY